MTAAYVRQAPVEAVAVAIPGDLKTEVFEIAGRVAGENFSVCIRLTDYGPGPFNGMARLEVNGNIGGASIMQAVDATRGDFRRLAQFISARLPAAELQNLMFSDRARGVASEVTERVMADEKELRAGR